jgi:excisionase family DNA binding protein
MPKKSPEGAESFTPFNQTSTESSQELRPMLNLSEAAQILRVDEKTVRREIEGGKLDACRIGKGDHGDIRIKPEDLERYLEEAKNRNAARPPRKY